MLDQVYSLPRTSLELFLEEIKNSDVGDTIFLAVVVEVTATVGVVLVMSVKAVLFVDVLVITAVCTAVVLVTSTLSNVVVSVTVSATSATVIVSVSVGELFGKPK